MIYEEYIDLNAEQLTASLNTFQAQEVPKGFIDTHENGKLLVQCLLDNKMTPTVENLVACARAHTPEKGYKMYYSPQELSLRNMRANFTEVQLAAFDTWWARQKHLVHSPQTENAILAQMLGRVFTNDNFDAAAGRCSHTGQVSEQSQPSRYQPGQYSGRNDLKDEVRPEEMLDVFGKPIHKSTTYRNSIRESYEAAVRARAERDQVPETNEQAEAQRECENMRGNTHSRTNEIQKCFVTKNGQIDWVATRNVRRQIQDMPGDGRGSGRSV